MRAWQRKGSHESVLHFDPALPPGHQWHDAGVMTPEAKIPAGEMLDLFIDSAPLPEAADTEADYLTIYQQNGLAKRPPIVAAIIGGRLADRLAWTFTAGYQAVVRSIFPTVTTTGLAAFAATENTTERELYPATSITEPAAGEGGQTKLLSGCKSWVAHSRYAEQLVVTVGSRTEGRCFLVQVRNGETLSPGIELEHRPLENAAGERRFLAAMSQGFARFDRVPVMAEFPAGHIRSFVKHEPIFVMLACLGFISAQSRVSSSQLADLAVQLASQVEVEPTALPDPARMATLDRRFGELVRRFESLETSTATPDFATDRALLSLYSKALQKRASA